MKYTIEDILECLNFCRVRASYSAVAEVIGVHQLNVGKLLPHRCAYYSWIVYSEGGKPADYADWQHHPELFNRNMIIRDSRVLLALLERDFAVLA